ncbi:MAG: alpha/beta hydrolase [Rhodovibrionaceae bacterium]|nr:alpha/beta hydrolase [Rhodovibrionaceae bacterium]
MADHLIDCTNAQSTHRVAVHAWGDPQAPRAVVCLHGLTRNARDFDFLAEALAPRARVVALDAVGRGESDWLPEGCEYGYPQYLADVQAVFDRLGLSAVDWVGTSMGGLVGMFLAAQQPEAISRLVINDVGPFIPKAALERIGDYVGADPFFENLDEVRAYFAEVHAPFGPLDDRHIDHMARHGVRADASGSGYRLRYDPRIGEPFQGEDIEDVDLWEVWDAIACPTLVLRGADSDLLLAETAREMAQRGPRAEVVEIPGCGHAPSLMQPDQIEVVKGWLFGT